MSKRSKACDITPKVKEIVWNRDKHRCIICGRYVSKTFANAHYIKRSQGGLGIPENIVTLCLYCHQEEDFGSNTKFYENKIETYLKSIYGTMWNKEKLIFKKGVYPNGNN